MINDRPAVHVVLCSCPDEASAKRIAEALVVEKQAKCVSVLSPMQSFFIWENQLNKAQEYLLIIKTLDKHWASLEAMIKKLHPYTVPEIIALPASRVAEAYKTWLTH